VARSVGKKLWSALRGALGQLAVPLVAVVLGLAVGTVFILLAGLDPIAAYKALWTAVAGKPRNFGETLVSTIPLIFTGLSVALAFRCGLFNIGAEGQYLVGQLATAVVGYAIALPTGVHPFVAMVAGMLAGALWASIVGLLKAYRGVHEVINSIMLNYTAIFFTHYLLMGFLRDPKAIGGAATRPVLDTAALAQGLIAGSRLHAGLWIALFAAFAVWFFLWRTPYGYEIRAVGFAPGAAEYAGISVKKNIVLAMALSGALAGLAGAIQTLALQGKFYETTSFVGFGLDGIAVALVGQNHPLGVVLAAFLFGVLDRGGPVMQAVAGVPKQIVWIVQGSVVFFVAAEGLWKFMRNKRVKAEVKSA
jgi:simple sugar transport system permease protein